VYYNINIFFFKSFIFNTNFLWYYLFKILTQPETSKDGKKKKKKKKKKKIFKNFLIKKKKTEKKKKKKIF